jgi:hypothetical protein
MTNQNQQFGLYIHSSNNNLNKIKSYNFIVKNTKEI